MGWNLSSKDPISCHSNICLISSAVLQQTVENDEIGHVVVARIVNEKLEMNQVNPRVPG